MIKWGKREKKELIQHGKKWLAAVMLIFSQKGCTVLYHFVKDG